jgi:hypothetical protein
MQTQAINFKPLPERPVCLSEGRRIPDIRTAAVFLFVDDDIGFLSFRQGFDFDLDSIGYYKKMYESGQ